MCKVSHRSKVTICPNSWQSHSVTTQQGGSQCDHTAAKLSQLGGSQCDHRSAKTTQLGKTHSWAVQKGTQESCTQLGSSATQLAESHTPKTTLANQCASKSSLRSNSKLTVCGIHIHIHIHIHTLTPYCHGHMHTPKPRHPTHKQTRTLKHPRFSGDTKNCCS